ncbi:unnamed protein product [Miscanthus lutarioriparius]|uniref:Uncharacterized protein n=1 Tax=Miscanthus lutarioriparius TaxID=422564 RepID=A0A811PJU3_9POAL|nr:unnamed protein product [Miscanthus lutarioriparius]
MRRHVHENGPREWSSIRSKGLLPRTGESCRLRWVNQLRPDIKKGCKFSAEEERVVIDLQAQFGNKWARIATYLSGRTDNDVKNFWSTQQKRLARLLRAPAPRRRPGGGSGRQSCGGASSSNARASTAQKLQLLCQSPCQDMIPIQETKPLLHKGGQSSSRREDQEPRPRTVALAISLPTHSDSASEFGSSGTTPTAATRLLSCGGGGSPASGVDPLVFVDPDDDDAFCPEPLAVVPPSPFFGMDEEYVDFGSSMHQGVRFDDLTPETLDFFGLPPSAQPYSDWWYLQRVTGGTCSQFLQRVLPPNVRLVLPDL